MSRKIQMIYKIDAIDFLLDKDAILSRYYPLIPYKKALLVAFHNNNIHTNYDCLNFADSILIEHLKSDDLVNLFKRFLRMYEADDSKLKIVENLKISEQEKASYRELFLLPGVKETRANLYYLSGFKTLKDIAECNVEQISAKMKESIVKNKLDYAIALPKEIKTHIAVAKAYCL